MSLLLPTALFALLALALPLLIHLQRRRETPPPRPFAALAYIDPQARPKQRVRLRDRLLLLLRLLLLAVLALLLAQPLLHGRAGAPWVLLWPGLDPAQVGAVDEDAELRWLAPGFPRIDALSSVEANQPFSLLRQLAFERPLEQEIDVRVPRELDGWDGVPLQLGRAVEWTVLPVELPALPSEPRAQRVAVQVMDGVEPEQRRVLTALRAYFEGLGEGSPLRFVEAGEAPPAEGVDALWVMASMQASEPREADAPEQPRSSDAEAQDDADGNADAVRTDPDVPGSAARTLANTNADRGGSAATVGQGPPDASALQSLSPAWRAWLREGGRVLVSGAGEREPHSATWAAESAAAVMPAPQDQEAVAPAQAGAQGHSPRPEEHEASALSGATPVQGTQTRQTLQSGHAASGAAGLSRNDCHRPREDGSPARSPGRLDPRLRGDDGSMDVEVDTCTDAELHGALDARARTLWRGEQARLSALHRDGAELRLLDCALEARCLPELLGPAFPHVVQTWLAPEPAPASRIDASLIAPRAEGQPPQPAGTPLRDALVLVLLLVLLAERWLAATRRPA